MVLSPNVLLSDPPKYQYECPECCHHPIVVSEQEYYQEQAVIMSRNINFPFILDFTKCDSLHEVCELLNKCKITIYAKHPEYHYLKERYS